MKKCSKIYLDNAATTPVDPQVLKKILPYFTNIFGNTMGICSVSQRAAKALESSRQIFAKILNCQKKELIFTSSATESNNLALKGVASANRDKGNHIIISSIEHDCVLESANWLEDQGFTITKIPVDKNGLVDPREIEKAITKKTILVSIIHANNEIGTINPIEEIGKTCRQKGVYFHTDAAQSFGKIPIDVKKMNVDLLTASSHKTYGPKGVALLYIKKGVKIEPVLHGGGQEFGMRSSTVNVAAIVGFAEAAKIATREMEKESKRQTKLRNKIISEITTKIKDVKLNGHKTKRLPNNINLSFKYIEGEAIMMMLDDWGIVVSTGSACSSSKLEPSHVLMAIGLKPQLAQGSIRISLGKYTKEKDINCLIDVLPKVVKKLRKLSPFK